jgi:hypothetical protein
MFHRETSNQNLSYAPIITPDPDDGFKFLTLLSSPLLTTHEQNQESHETNRFDPLVFPIADQLHLTKPLRKFSPFCSPRKIMSQDHCACAMEPSAWLCFYSIRCLLHFFASKLKQGFLLHIWPRSEYLIESKKVGGNNKGTMKKTHSVIH